MKGKEKEEEKEEDRRRRKAKKRNTKLLGPPLFVTGAPISKEQTAERAKLA
jgi:hypothetical protein